MSETSVPPTSPRPAARLAGFAPYGVPRHPAPVDLRLDANEGATPPAELAAAVAAAPRALRRYPSAAGLEAALARRFGLPEERVLATAGADDGLWRALAAVAGPGRRVVVPVPTFEMIPRYVAVAGAALVEVAWPPGAPWPLEAVLERVDGRTAAVTVVSPNNPTGGVATATQLRALAAAAPHALLVVDQAYAEYGDEDLLAAARGLPNVALLRSFSKAWGLAALRVGWATASPEVLGWMRALGHPYALAGPSAALAAAALDGDDAWLADHLARVRAERAELAALLTRLGQRPFPSQANFVLARFADAPWVADALAGLGIAVRRFPDDGRLEDCLRITCPGDAADQERLARGLETALAPQALLLDLDGVVADVSRSYRRAVVETAAAFGVALDAEAVSAAKAAGDANDDWVLTRRLLAERGVEVALEEVVERFEALYQGTPGSPGLRRHERAIPPPGLLRRLADRRPLAVVTGRPRSDARRFLAEHGLEGVARVLVTMEDAPSKPDPAPVRLALERLGVERAWMVGDTPDDARAARAAGVVPLGVLAPGEGAAMADALLAAGAARVLGDLAELEELLP